MHTQRVLVIITGYGLYFTIHPSNMIKIHIGVYGLYQIATLYYIFVRMQDN